MDQISVNTPNKYQSEAPTQQHYTTVPAQKYWSVCLSVGLASEVPKLTHYWVVLLHPRA